MSLVKWAFIGLLVLPAAEIVGFLLVAAWIGWLWAGILFVATSVIGVMALKRSGRRDLARLADALRTGGILALHIDAPGVATMLGAILLIIPGFITDVLGGALFVPALRRWMAGALARANQRDKHRDHKRQPGPRPNVIDLEPGEWHQIVDRSRAGRRKSSRRPSKSGAKTGAKSRP
jgi:UPF0716 protein FxsA